jgi:hypothetical protein
MRRPNLNPAFKRFQVLPEPPAIRIETALQMRDASPSRKSILMGFDRAPRSSADTQQLPA